MLTCLAQEIHTYWPRGTDSPNDGATVFVADVRHDVHVWRPELELALPVDDGRERRADEERTAAVTLKTQHTV